MQKIYLLLLLLLPLISLLGQSLTVAEHNLLLEMLHRADLDSLSLTYEKDWDLSTKFKNPAQLAELQNPWLAFQRLDSLREGLAPDSSNYLKAERLDCLSSLVSGQEVLPNVQEAVFDAERYKAELERLWDLKVHKAEDVFAYLEHVLWDFADDLQACQPWVAQTADSLGSFYFQSFHESENPSEISTFLESRSYPQRVALGVLNWNDRLQEIDLGALYRMQSRYLILFDLIHTKASGLSFPKHRPIVHQSRFGLMIIGSTGSDRYPQHLTDEQSLCFMLEPGGNDFYELQIANSSAHPFYLFLDLEGDDLYQNRTIAGMFSVFRGMGFSADLAGNDIYRGGDFAFSAGLGSMIHRDFSGEDIYDCGLFSQGAAFFGTALLIDEAGDDLYSATTMAQGLGSTCGLGAILDLHGSDRYLLGRIFDHAPLMPNDYRSMGQGMGFGFRPDFAGGIGLIYDAGGNDKYMGGVYAQGVGYWYATGILIDESGNDVYNAVYYPQGSGIHLANGYLFDGSGDDAYYTRNGPGQGAGHDWGLGILLDKSGDDAYSIPGGNGLGLSNSVGIFVDSRGNDRYERKVENAYGYGIFSRRAGSLGLFLDTGGMDVYPDSLWANNKFWQRGNYGMGHDLELYSEEQGAVTSVVDDALVDSLASISEVFAAAAEWEVGSAAKRVRNAREVLLSRAAEAIPYILGNKLNSKIGLEYRALEELVLHSTEFKTELYRYIDAADSLQAKNALSLIAATGDSLLLEPVKRLLEQNKYLVSCLSVLGSIKTSESIDILETWLHSPVERYRYIVAGSLLRIGNQRAMSLLRGMKGDRSFLIESMLRSLPEGDSGS